ncbi:MAG: hypothetical protein RSB81_02435 [Anaerovoracaceae bacterium]
MECDYAELSKMAKANGGSEKLVDVLINSGKRKMFPNISLINEGVISIVDFEEFSHQLKGTVRFIVER